MSSVFFPFEYTFGAGQDCIFEGHRFVSMPSDHNSWTIDTVTAALILAVLEVEFRGSTPCKRATKIGIAW